MLWDLSPHSQTSLWPSLPTLVHPPGSLSTLHHCCLFHLFVRTRIRLFPALAAPRPLHLPPPLPFPCQGHQAPLSQSLTLLASLTLTSLCLFSVCTRSRAERVRNSAEPAAATLSPTTLPGFPHKVMTQSLPVWVKMKPNTITHFLAQFGKQQSLINCCGRVRGLENK